MNLERTLLLIASAVGIVGWGIWWIAWRVYLPAEVRGRFVPIWKARHQFRPPGFLLHMIGGALVAVGIAMIIVAIRL